VTPATGGATISADTAANASVPAWTTLTGPSIDVTAAGDISTGTVTFTTPSGFAFNSASTPTINAGTSGLAGTCGAPSSTSITCTVTSAVTAAGTIAFSGIAMQPTAKTPLASGSVTLGGTAGLSGTAASLAEIPGTATKLAFSVPPGGGTAFSVWATQPTIVVQDAAGNTVTTSGTSVALAIGTNPAAGALTCTANPLSTTSGAAAFGGCSINKAGTGYTLVGSSAGLTSATSQSFAISAAQNGLVFTTQPGGGTAGTAWATQPVISVQDPGGTTDTTSAASITLQIGNNPNGGTLTCTGGLTKAASSGVAVFVGCSIDKPGAGYTLTATASGLTGISSAPFNIVAGAPASVVFSVQPGGGAAGFALSPQPQVTLKDSVGNVATGSSALVTLAIAAGTGTSGATLTCSGGNALNASSGVATFAGCAINKAGTGYKLTATISGLASATSTTFIVSAAPATQLVVTTQPSSSAGAGTAFAVQPVVTIKDASGVTVTASTAAVTLQITPATGTSGAIMTCTGGLTKTATSGVASFTGCNIDLLGAGYTITATADNLTTAVTTAITIVPGVAAKLAFTTQPVGSGYGTPFATQPVVTIQDKLGNTVTSSSLSVTLAITAGTGTSGAVLSCSGGTAKAGSSGVATFSGCSITKAGTGYTLTATATSVTIGISTSFNIAVGPPAKVVFSVQPGGASVGTSLNPQPIVSIVDAAGNLVTTSALPVDLAITGGTGVPGATLSCAGGTTLSASAGIASFTGCTVDKTGSNYTLTASSTGLTSAVSATFAITAGVADKLAYQVQPTGGAVGSLLSQQPVVLVQDVAGNTITTSNASITLSIGTNPTGGTLTCTGGLTKAAASGVAAFAGCKIDKVGSGYTITATSAGLHGTTSAPLDIVPGVPAKVAFVSQPSGATYSTAFATQPAVAVQDSLGNTVTSFSGTVVLALTPLTGTSGAILSCTGGLSLATVGGVANYAGCMIDKPGSNYTLTATLTGVANGLSSAFTIAPGTASQLIFATQPVGSSAGIAFATQPTVKVLDAGGNVVTGSSAGITLSVTPGTGTAGATLTCTGGNTKFATAGVAAFSGCSIDKVGANYTLTASATGLTSGVSAVLQVVAGLPAKVGFTVPPAGAVAGSAFLTQPVVAIQDAGGNTVLSSTASVTLSITTGTGAAGATISCAGGLTVAAVNGLATFNGCQITKAAANYTLKAASGTLIAGTSAAFTVSPGAPSRLLFTTQPVGSTYGAPFTSQPVVTIQDAYGNVATQSSLAVTLAISPGTGAAGATLSCTGGTTISAIAGLAAFSGCTIDKASTTYVLVATASGVAGASSSTFSILPGIAAKLAFTTQPAGASANTAFASQPVVTVQDAAGNPVTTSTVTITLAITTGTGTSGAILSCGTTTSKVAVAGVATFSTCKIDRPGTAYSLTASGGGLTLAVSTAFDITSGPPAKVVFSTQPVGAAINAPFATQPVVTVQDTAGNTATTSPAIVTLAITTGTGATGAILTCSGGLSMAAVNGVAAFSGCTIDRPGATYTLKATSGVLTAATSTAFVISSGPATKLAMTTQPAGAAAGVPFTTQPVVTVQDASSGTTTGSSASVTLALGVNPAGATLTCTGGLTKVAVGGIATFAGCTLDKVGTGFTIVASSAGLTDATSVAFNVVAAPAAKLLITTQPSASAPYGTAFTQQPIVAVQDALGNTVSTANTLAVAITPGTGVAGAKLACTGGLTKATVAGIAVFSGCSIDKAGAGYTLTFTSGSLTVAVSAAITITPGAAAKAGFTTMPSLSAAAGVPFLTQPVVAIQDAAGNTVTTSTATVTLSIVAPTGTTATLSCSGGLSHAAIAGVAAFSGCAIDMVGSGYVIEVDVTGLANAKTPAIAITPGAAAKAGFTTSPIGSAGGVVFTTQPVVAIQDAYGNTVTVGSSVVALSIAPGSGTAGAVLTCTGGLTKATANGVAAFAGCTVDKTGLAYKLTATVTGLTAGTSTAFDVSQGPPKQVGFYGQPVAGPGGLDFPTQPVIAIQDAGGSMVSSATGTITIGITPGTGTPGAILDCPGGLTRTIAAGTAAFTGCTIDLAGTGYTLTATSGALTKGVSAKFNVGPAVASIAVTPLAPTVGLGGAAMLGLAFRFGGAGATVNLEESLDGTTWTLVSPITMDATGSATFRYLFDSSRWLRATYAGDGTLLQGTGTSVRVTVLYATSLRPTNKGTTKTITHGKAIAFTASVRPTVATSPRTAVTFEVWKLVGAKWAFVTRKVVWTTASGAATFKWTFKKTGTWSVRARAAGTTQNGTSPWTAREIYRVI